MQSLTNSTSVVESSQDNALIELLNKQSDEYRYVLLNPLKIVSDSNPLHVPTLRSMLGERAVLPVLRGDLTHSPQHCPQLVLLASPQESCEFSWLAGSLGYARNESLHEKRYLCAWLSSAVPPEELAVILADQCNHLSTNMFIPMFEPLRFELLQAFSPPNALAASIWPVSHWWYVSTTGEIACQSGKAYEEKWRLNWGGRRYAAGDPEHLATSVFMATDAHRIT